MSYKLRNFSFGQTSMNKLKTCHKDIQKILLEAIKIIDITVLEGIRSTERQQQLFEEGRSKIDGINIKSKHQGKLDEDGNLVSYAIDIYPYIKGEDPFDNNPKNLARYYYMMGIIDSIAHKLYEKGEISHLVRFGLDWDGDHLFTDQNFDDLPHFELVKPKKI